MHAKGGKNISPMIPGKYLLLLRRDLVCTKRTLATEYLAYNLGHNILELYNVLVQILLTTSKTKRDI